MRATGNDSLFSRHKGLSDKHYLAVTLALALAIAFLVYRPHLLDSASIEPDLRNFYLVHRTSNADLFPGQSLGELELASPLYTAILWGSSLFLPPNLASKLLVFPLLIVCTTFLFLMGKSLRGPALGMALALGFTIFNLASDTDNSIAGGLQRSFALPLLIAEAYFLMHRKTAAVAVVLLLVGLIYLPVLPVAGLTAASVLLFKNEDGRWEMSLTRRQAAILLGIAGLIIVAVSPFLMTAVWSRLLRGIDLMRSGTHLLNDPIYRPGGPRVLLHYTFPIFGRGGIFMHGSAVFQFQVLAVLSLIILVVRRGKRARLPMVLRRMMWVSFLMFGLSWLAILATSTFLLYLPSRHTHFSLFLCLLVFVVLNGKETIEALVRFVHGRRNNLLSVAGGALILIVAAVITSLVSDAPRNAERLWAQMRAVMALLGVVLGVLIIVAYRRQKGEPAPRSAAEHDLRPLWLVMGVIVVVVGPLYIRATGPPFLQINEDDMALYNFLQTLPVDTVVAGDPCSLDSVPFFGRLSVLYRCATAENHGEALVAGLDAYYAEQGSEVVAFCRRYGVDVLIVDRRTLSREVIASGEVTYEPYNSQLMPRLRDREAFVLAQVEPANRLFDGGDKYVVPCVEEVLVAEQE